MKKYEFPIYEMNLKLFFPHKRIKTKVQIIEVLMETIRYMMQKPEAVSVEPVGKIVLYVDKMSRLFFFKDKKFYSIGFPFFVSEEDGKLRFWFNDYLVIDSELVSNVMAILKCEEFDNKCSLDFVEPIYEYEVGYNDEFWFFLKELFLIEDGYIRYDIDQESYDQAEQKDTAKKHPLTHYDIFYTNIATFKVGLSKEICDKEFIDFLNINTDCGFIK